MPPYRSGIQGRLSFSSKSEGDPPRTLGAMLSAADRDQIADTFGVPVKEVEEDLQLVAFVVHRNPLFPALISAGRNWEGETTFRYLMSLRNALGFTGPPPA